MNSWESFKVAWAGIVGNKMRSFLTMLGVIIGVASVIILVSIAQGTTESIKADIENMGSNVITIMTQGGSARLTLDDVAKLEESMTTAVAVVPSTTGTVTLKYGTNTYETTLEGTTQDYPSLRNHDIAYGSFFDEKDVDSRRRVVVLGKTVAEELFGRENALGETIKVNGQNYTVIGVLDEKGAVMNTDRDDIIYMPITSAQRLLGSTQVRTVNIQAESKEVNALAVNEIRSFFEQRFNNPDAARIFSQDDLLASADSMGATLTLMLGAIAGVALIVGGIGIMNIMLVSVTERTREIGIRKAIGATKKDILGQFLVESIILSISGGIVGLFAGVGGTLLISKVADWPAVFSPVSFVVAFGFAAFVGLFFGVYPAYKAASLDPIEALRYE